MIGRPAIRAWLERRRRIFRAWLLAAAATPFGLGCALRPAPARPVGSVEEHVGAQLPLDTPFTASDGKPLVLGDVVGRGKPSLLVLAYSRCSMLCSLVVHAAADLVPVLGMSAGKDFSLVTLSFDPRETPGEADRTRALALERAGDSAHPEDWPFLVGTEPAIRRVADALGFRYAWDPRSEQYAHPAVLFAISATGRVEGYFYDLRPDPSSVRAALRGAPFRHASALGEAVLQCFRFDALGRKYGPIIQRSFQAGAAAVALGLGLGVIVLFRRERRQRRHEDGRVKEAP